MINLNNFESLLIVTLVLIMICLITLPSAQNVDPYINTSVNASVPTNLGTLPDLTATRSDNIDPTVLGQPSPSVRKLDVGRGESIKQIPSQRYLETDTILNYPADPKSKLDMREYPESEPLAVSTNSGFIRPPLFVQPYDVQTNKSVVRRLRYMEAENKKLKRDMSTLNNVVMKMYKTDAFGDYVVNGWFVQFHNVTTDTTDGVTLSSIIKKIHGVPKICFRARDGLPFLGTPDKPILFPRPDKIGLKAMTVMKVPKTGFYDFKILADDGVRVYFQKVNFDVITNEKNIRSTWNLAIDSWIDQAEVWLYSKKYYFNENDLIMIRFDYYELDGYASACIRMRYHLQLNDTDNPNGREFDIPYKSSYCSLLWSEVPLLGFP